MRVEHLLSTVVTFIAFATAVAALYDRDSDVRVVTAKNFQEEVFGTETVVLAEFFAPWCGHCQRLVPEYKKAAKSLKGLVKVVAIDCDDDAQKPLCGAQQIKGFPTIKVFSPRVSKKNPLSFTKSATDYQGQRTAKAMVDFAISQIPNYVVQVSESRKSAKSLPDFLSLNATELAHVILVSNKKDTPPLYKALANQFRNRLIFGEIKDGEKNLMDKVGVESAPAVKLWPVGEESPLVYEGSLKHDALAKFLEKYAKALPKRKEQSSKASSSEKSAPPPEPEHQEPFNPEVSEIRSQEDLALILQKPGFTVIAFVALEPQYEESVTSHAEVLALLQKSKEALHAQNSPFNSFVWINAVQRGQKLMQDFGVSDMLPSLMVVNSKKKVYRVMTNAFDDAGLTTFFKDVSHQRGRFYTFTSEPVIDKVPKSKAAAQEAVTIHEEAPVPPTEHVQDPELEQERDEAKSSRVKEEL
ncbi:hypothetical protein M427DRAFT_66424 [Gonapodya prolifera JEL478]|uniref:protein disulfide-isomerase n=1 Tax=Gonapodya prolifera (strain JEL478) TaxID=1344416 RepID=A0A139AUI7_GONPJ|nr:hypothetical protein M427DRAFT_66424 [Gonapodya prolifera JEL478]|eukprot:KXS20406.1 hypothetical protein M427DRAFT_66424 [Gonapodya prolifera JEL478]